jgi:hypothetical protein
MSGNTAFRAAELCGAALLVKQITAVLALSNTSFDLTASSSM